MKDKLETIKALEKDYATIRVETDKKAKMRVQRSNDDALDVIENREQDLRNYKETLMAAVKVDLEKEKERLEAQHEHDRKTVIQEFEAKRENVIQTMIEEVFKYGNR